MKNNPKDKHLDMLVALLVLVTLAGILYVWSC